jgi:hypothetical protein
VETQNRHIRSECGDEGVRVADNRLHRLGVRVVRRGRGRLWFGWFIRVVGFRRRQRGQQSQRRVDQWYRELVDGKRK